MNLVKISLGLTLLCRAGSAAAVEPESILTPPVVIASETQGAIPLVPTVGPQPTSAPSMPQAMPNDPALSSKSHFAASLETATAALGVPSVRPAPIAGALITSTAEGVSFTAMVTATPAPAPFLMSGNSLWVISQRQVAEITAREHDGSMNAVQAAKLRAELKSILSSYGLNRSSDSAKISPARREQLNRKLEIEAEKIRQASTKS